MIFKLLFICLFQLTQGEETWKHWDIIYFSGCVENYPGKMRQVACHPTPIQMKYIVKKRFIYQMLTRL